MMKYPIIAFLLTVAIAAPLSAATPAPPPPQATNVEQAAIDRVVDALNTFSVEMYGLLKERPGNVVFSPASITTALSMACVGARRSTAEQLTNSLHLALIGAQTVDNVFQQLESDLYSVGRASAYKLRTGNALWVRQGAGAFDNYSIATVRNTYGAELFEVDFAGSPSSARKTIHAWARQRAWFWLGDFIPPDLLTQQTSMMLANISLFEGRWDAAFSKHFTQKSTFWVTPARGVTTRMMSRSGAYYYREGRTMQVIEMPLAGDVASMVVLLPKQAGALSTIERQMTPEYVKKWISRLSPREVVVSLPKLDLATVTNLTEPLMSLGVRNAFQSDAADFSGINGASDLSLWTAIQKNRIIVNEDGGSGAAAPSIATHPIADGLAYFNANQPFIFLIRENSSGRILFMGRVVNPLT